eukprot:965625-Prymnesium_polylepis.1
MGAAAGCAHVRVQCLCAVLGALTWVGDAALRERGCCNHSHPPPALRRAPLTPHRSNVALHQRNVLTPSPSHISSAAKPPPPASSHLPSTPPRSRTASLPPRKAARPTPAHRTPHSRGTAPRPSPGPPRSGCPPASRP